MFRNGAKSWLAASLSFLALSCGSINSALACGPFSNEAVYTYKVHPDLPLKFYAQGKLGIPKPSYARSYLVVAYRYLSGKPLSSAEQTGVCDFWKSRLQGGYSEGYGGASDVWFKYRNQVLAAKSQDNYFDVYRSPNFPDYYTSYLNCAPDAFKTAKATLEARLAKYGSDKKSINQWIAGQDAVFCHCHGPGYDYRTNKPGTEPPLPVALEAGAPVWLKQDRAYQIAAACFYSEKLDQALADFKAIAADGASPWQKLARYMIARCYVRKGTLAKKEGIDTHFLQQAHEYIDGLLKDGAFQDLKTSLEELSSFVELRLHPQEELKRVALQLTRGEYGEAGIYRSLDDFVYLLDQAFAEDPEDPKTTHEVKDEHFKTVMREADLTDFVWTFSSDDKESLAHAKANYLAKKTQPWLLCYASKLAKGSTDGDGKLVEEALKAVKVGDAGYLWAQFELDRLSRGNLGSGYGAALAQLSAKAQNPSARNEIDLLRLEQAGNFNDLVSLAFARPTAIVGDYEMRDLPEDYEKINEGNSYPKLEPSLRPEAADLFNYWFSLANFSKLLKSSAIPANLKFDFTQAYMVRAYLLGNMAEASRAALLLKPFLPQAQAELASMAGAAPADKAFAFAFFILKNPGARPVMTASVPRDTEYSKIDDFRDNWWDNFTLDCKDKSPQIAGAVLSAADYSQARTEMAKLKVLPPSIVYLGRTVLDYARKHPQDPRVPQALHRIVKGSKVAGGDGVSEISKEAFGLLHKRYGGSSWAKQTPYYY